MSEQWRRAEPRFDLDLKWGIEAERKIRKLFRCFVSDDPRVEVKRKRYIDLKFYIETHCDKGRTGCYAPSGISVTTAELWAFLIDDSGLYILMPTRLVRDALDEATTKDVEEADGNCPTRGKLIDFHVILYRLQQERKRAAEQCQSPNPVTCVTTSEEHADAMAFDADRINWGDKLEGAARNKRSA